MFVRRMGGLLGLWFCIAGMAGAQEQETQRPGKAQRVLRPVAFASRLTPPKRVRRAQLTPVTPVAAAKLPAKPPRQQPDRNLPPVSALPLRVTSSRTSLLTESRIPIGEFWNGRVQFSGVQQRFHSATLYSVIGSGDEGQVAVAPGLTGIAGRARVNYGIGLHFRFGR